MLLYHRTCPSLHLQRAPRVLVASLCVWGYQGLQGGLRHQNCESRFISADSKRPRHTRSESTVRAPKEQASRPVHLPVVPLASPPLLAQNPAVSHAGLRSCHIQVCAANTLKKPSREGKLAQSPGIHGPTQWVSLRVSTELLVGQHWSPAKGRVAPGQ